MNMPVCCWHYMQSSYPPKCTPSMVTFGQKIQVRLQSLMILMVKTHSSYPACYISVSSQEIVTRLLDFFFPCTKSQVPECSLVTCGNISMGCRLMHLNLEILYCLLCAEFYVCLEAQEIPLCWAKGTV